MSTETSICKYCGELILLLGFQWVHSKTQLSKCEQPINAAPIDRIPESPISSSAYYKGLSEGRRATVMQERQSNLYRGPLSGVAKQILARAFDERFEDVKRVEGTCESPAEELFALAMLIDSSLRYDQELNHWRDLENGIVMAAQVEIGGYRADFVFNHSLVVEIDGHDFHDRDHEQASSDRKRDRDVLRSGYVVIRFTGSDVYNFPLRCVGEVVGLLKRRIRID